jgi:predicted DNA-binding transcriptional regulator AlpA
MPATLVKRLLRLDDLTEIFGVSRITIRQWVKAGALPEPYRPGGKKCFWEPTAIERALLNGLKAQPGRALKDRGAATEKRN